MHSQDLFAPAHIRTVHHYAPVKTSGTQQRRIEYVGPVRRRHQDDAFVRLEPVHFHQQLVQRLLALIVSATQTSATMTSHRVDFINEDDARRILLALLEQIAHAARAHANEHLDEV